MWREPGESLQYCSDSPGSLQFTQGFSLIYGIHLSIPNPF